MLTIPTPTSVPEIRVSNSIAFVSDIVYEISRSLKSGVSEILVDVPVSSAPNLISKLLNVASVYIPSSVSHNLPNISLPTEVAFIPPISSLNIDALMPDVLAKIFEQSFGLPDILVNISKNHVCDLPNLSMHVDDHAVQNLTGLSLVSKSFGFKIRDVQSVLSLSRHLYYVLDPMISPSSYEHDNVNLKTLAGTAIIPANV